MLTLAPLTLVIIAAILFTAALAFLAAELLVPAHGILALFCILFAVLGVVACYLAHPALGIVSGILMLGIAPFAFYAAVRLYPNTPMGRRIILKRPAASTPAAQAEAEKLAALVGKTGTAATTLRPVGACDIEGKRVECVSESTIIEAGTPIEVTRVLGVRVIVRPVQQPLS